MKIGAGIVARSSSARFPRKHLAELGGLPMIVQIIKKLQRLKHLDYIILTTTINPSDNELCKVASEAGAEIIRGPERDILERDIMAVTEYNLDAMLMISGDCPFTSNAYSQILINGLLTEPDPHQYDFINGMGNLSPIEGLGANISMRSAFGKYKMLMKKYENKYSYEQYGQVMQEEPDIFKAKIIDTSAINPLTITPMKTSIDWNLERLLWNKVIDWLGYYPETVEDFNKAFGGIMEL